MADVLRRRIAFGAYAPGDRLPTERDLAQALGVGRMTVRSAVRSLSGEGLLETRRGRTGGTFVTERRSIPNSALATRSSLGEVRETFEFRLALEPTVAAWCAAAASDDDRREIVRIAEQVPVSVAAYRALDSRFHVAIAGACGNTLARDAIRRAREEFFTWADAFFDVVWTPDLEMAMTSQREHVAIAHAIAAGDPDGARRLTSEHIRVSAADYEAIVAGRGLPSRP